MPDNMNNFKTKFLRSVALLATTIFCASVTSVSQTVENPNILIIMTDQQAWDAVGYSGMQ